MKMAKGNLSKEKGHLSDLWHLWKGEGAHIKRENGHLSTGNGVIIKKEKGHV